MFTDVSSLNADARAEMKGVDRKQAFSNVLHSNVVICGKKQHFGRF